MTTLTISLSTQPSDGVWGKKTSLSFSHDSAVIHIDPDNEPLRTIQQAARKLDGMSIPHVTLSGEWTWQQQWAFALSFTRANHTSTIVWCDNEDKVKLTNAYASLVFTRSLVNDTPENMSPVVLASKAAEWLTSLAPDKVSSEIIQGEALIENGWQGIWEVGRGSERPPAMLVLDYNPTANNDAPIEAVLVGKGITFDSGGYSIKSSEGMLDMKADMAGAATVTGSLGLAIMQGLSKRVQLILCCAENLISGHAYKLGDIITYKNGVTVEVVNTDAEGRLVLADGLMAASETGAPLVIDAATLTGAAVNAVGTDYHAVFTNDQPVANRLFSVANEQAELFWQLPLASWHTDKCPSHFADTANSRPVKGGGAGGASNAAGFLARFAPASGWLHLDLAAAYHGNPTSEMPAGATGKGILTLAALLNAA
ncbi:aminopeptidase PepB [Alteromonas sediminis]|uniref:Aminopeptidase PepB n=1 Tax=Alteromonas sediminis TaxID=2259342 RepID=A0A3N5XWV3_9ALTE|nr:aminopeptidase PepB [Alteromonas sediminis]RPJ64833.1 aminopeptidase PepB [Alteromonas sediminis]